MSAKAVVGTDRRFVVLAGALAITAVVLLTASPSARALPIHDFDVQVSTNQAGAHPDLVIDSAVGTPLTEGEVPCRCNKLRDLIIKTPPGFVGTPTDIPRCSAADLATQSCPVDTQVGLVMARIASEEGEVFGSPLYNMIPAEGQLAALNAPAIGPVEVVVSARSESDYGLEFATLGIPNFFFPYRITTIVWGVPADPVHDALRFPFDGGKLLGRCDTGDGDPLPELINNEFPIEECAQLGFLKPWPPVSSNAGTVPFLSNPTACTGPLTATLDVVGYDLTTDNEETGFPAMVGCDQLAFEPSLAANPTTVDADAPSGVEVDLRVPQTLSAASPSPSQIRTVTMSLPEGFTINANAADGKTSCSAAQARFGTRRPGACPEFSKIGTAEIESSALPAPLPGAVYLGEPLPGERYRVFITADGFSINVKLAGVARPDPVTGKLDIIFSNLPQAPFQRFNLHIFGAERGILSTPEQCGSYAVDSTFVPWAAGIPNQTSTQFFTVEAGPGGTPCPPSPRVFNPSLNAGVTDNTSGSHTEFVFDLARKDGEQGLRAVNVSTPPGFSAVLAGIPYCPEGTLAALAGSSYPGVTELISPACPLSRVGTALTSAGAGSRPITLPGAVYLAGPYKGAPLSLVVVTPAVSGPYDLGNVPVRVAVHVDPVTARVTAVSDPFPQVVEGIPLRLRRILVTLDRDRFALNPTNCDPLAVDATAFGVEGATGVLTNSFQVANCGTMPFSPRLALRLSGGVNRRGHPAIRAVYTTRRPEANARRVMVLLPKGQLLDNSHVETVCTRVDYAAARCPAGSVIGRAEAISPLLDRPLVGRVYLRTSSNRLPDMVVGLKGQVDIELSARIDSVRGRLRTTFESIPDVPVSKFVLRLAGGRKGLVTNSERLCGTRKRARVVLAGQNGVRLRRRVKLRVACGSQSRRARSANGHHRRAAVQMRKGA